jgi:hypothetical protein
VTSIRDAIREILEEDNPQTVRQAFYALTVRGVITKAEIEYQRTVIRLLVDMREAGDIPPAYIYHFGDLDPSGVDAARDIEAKLRRYAPTAEIYFERPAVTREQVEQWNLPTRPTKMTDTRAKKFAGTSVELDAIPARQLRELVRSCIERLVNQEQLAVLRAAEESERETLGRWAKIMNGSAA